MMAPMGADGAAFPGHPSQTPGRALLKANQGQLKASETQAGQLWQQHISAALGQRGTCVFYSEKNIDQAGD